MPVQVLPLTFSNAQIEAICDPLKPKLRSAKHQRVFPPVGYITGLQEILCRPFSANTSIFTGVCRGDFQEKTKLSKLRES